MKVWNCSIKEVAIHNVSGKVYYTSLKVIKHWPIWLYENKIFLSNWLYKNKLSLLTQKGKQTKKETKTHTQRQTNQKGTCTINTAHKKLSSLVY